MKSWWIGRDPYDRAVGDVTDWHRRGSRATKPPPRRSRSTEMSHEHTQPAPQPTPTPCEALKCPKPRGAEAHCAACHHTFTTNGTFDRHRRATQCLNPHTATRRNREPIFEARTRRDGRTVYGYPGTWNPEAAA